MSFIRFFRVLSARIEKSRVGTKIVYAATRLPPTRFPTAHLKGNNTSTRLNDNVAAWSKRTPVSNIYYGITLVWKRILVSNTIPRFVFCTRCVLYISFFLGGVELRITRWKSQVFCREFTGRFSISIIHLTRISILIIFFRFTSTEHRSFRNLQNKNSKPTFFFI